MIEYKNPVPHIGGKKFALKMVFTFEEWIESDEAAASIEDYIRRNGIPASATSDITPLEEYK